MKTVFQMAHEALERMDADDYCREPYWTATDEELERFAELVRADEREACESRQTPGTGSVAILNGAADAIRARGNT